MADRSTKAIGAIRVGDKVLAKDPATGKLSARTVTTLHANRDTDLTDVTLADGRGGSTVLHTTDHHPFWDRQRGGWVDAADLHPGSQVTGPDNRPVRVLAVTSHTGSKLMNDLTVADIHTYYVMAGTTPVLVHNCDWTSPASLDRHYIDHGEDLGHYTKGDYDQGAKDLMCGSCRSGVREKDAMIEGKVYRWDPETNEFGVKDRGTNKIINYFDITDAHGGPAAYWGRQPGLER